MFNALKSPDCVLWVDLESPNDFEIECLIELFNFHPLAIEDCINDRSEPKLDDYDEYLFLVASSLSISHDREKDVEKLAALELNIFFGKNYVVTFHKVPIAAVAQIRAAVEKKHERFLGQGSDMLVHALLDRLVDDYQPSLDYYDVKIDKVEDAAFGDAPERFISTVLQLKRDLFFLRRMIAPQRELLSHLTRSSSPYIKQEHMIYFRDVYDHLVSIYQFAEGHHEMLSNLLQAYFSYSSHKLNEIIKHMTVMATLTMPAVLIASIYGMNFKHIPELDWAYGYHYAIGLSIVVSVGMLVWMKWRKWI
jgi:magnesium transporter